MIHPGILKVATITFANGGDNIGVYVPFFASYNFWIIFLIIFLFLCLVGIWCLLGYILVKHPLIAQILKRYGHLIVPLVLIGLGIFILVENDTVLYFIKIWSIVFHS